MMTQAYAKADEEIPLCDRCGTAKLFYHSPGGYYLDCPVCTHGNPAPPPGAGAGEGPE